MSIQRGDRVLQQLRNGTTEAQLPMALGIPRRMNPYAFEELLLTCCEEQGWRIQRNFCYSGDGGVDGRVLIVGKLYLVQAKRYTGHIKPEHIRGFHNVIHQEKTAFTRRKLLADSLFTLEKRDRYPRSYIESN